MLRRQPFQRGRGQPEHGALRRSGFQPEVPARTGQTRSAARKPRLEARNHRPQRSVGGVWHRRGRGHPGGLQPWRLTVELLLGRKIGEGEDDWAWSDEGGSTVRLHFAHGKLATFELDRPAP